METNMPKSLISGTLLGLALAAPAAAQVRLNGAGATFPNIIYQNWIITYNQQFDNVELNYQSIGSGGGIRQFSDKTVDFGGSDAPMTDSAIAAIQGNVLHIPTVLGAVVPTYNLPGVTAPLRFTPALLADIFLGKVTRWDDARMASANPGVTLPATDILVVHRSDGSGTTFVWVDYLSKVSPEWLRSVGRGTSVRWPVGLGGRGNEGVAATVRQTPGSIGYVELGYALINKMAIGQVQNRAGSFITPSLESVTAAAAGAMGDMGPSTDFRVSITDPAGAAAYPIASFTWLLLRKSYPDQPKARELLKFVWWAVTEGQAKAPSLGYAPLPKEMLPWIEARLKTVTGGGQPAWRGPRAAG
jgi:phosphate transport system substrate-binding protein